MAMAVLMVVSACSSESAPQPAVAAAPTEIEETTTTISTEDEVLAAYRASWDAFLEAADPPDPEHPRLLRTTTGEQLEAVQRMFAGDLASGFVRRGSFDLAPRVLSVEGRRAVVRDCMHDRGIVYEAATGEALTPLDEARLLVETVLVREAGTWKVAENDLVEVGCEPRR